MKGLLDKLSVWTAELIGLLSSKMTRKQRSSFGKIIGRILMLLDPKRVRITKDNISKAYPNENQDFVNLVAKESYYNLGITFTELFTCKYFSEQDYRDYIKYENIEIITDELESGNGMLMLSGHYGNWEMLAYTAGAFTGASVQIIVKSQTNKGIDSLVNDFRTSGNNTVVPMDKAAISIVRTVKNGGIVALLADQAASETKDIFVDFFGRPVSTYESPAYLALKFNIPVVCGFAVRQSDGTYSVKLSKLDHSDLRLDKEGITEFTRRHVKLLENEIRKHPGLWSWQHRRWKHTPPEEK